MNTKRLLAFLFSLPFVAAAETLHVGSGQAFTTIQSAINAASPGDVIQVAPGLYAENVVINKSPLALAGARTGSDARGRIPGVPNAAAESIISPAAGSAIELASASGRITISGFALSSPAAAGSGVVTLEVASADSLVFSENDVRVNNGSTAAALWLNRAAENATITRNVFRAATGSAHAIFLNGADSFDGLAFMQNDVLRDGAPGGSGFSCDGAEGIGPSALRAPLITGNRFQGHVLGFNGGSRSLSGAEISGNVFEGNTGGMAAGPRDCVLRDNLWKGNAQYGLRLTSFGDLADATRGARGNTIEENRFENNGSSVFPSGHGDLLFDDQADGTQETNVVHRNCFLSPVALFNSEGSSTIHAAYNYWGATDGPASGGEIAGTGSVEFEPWYTDSDLTVLNFGASTLDGDVTLEEGESISGGSLNLSPGAVLHVRHGASLVVDSLMLPDDASVRIDGGAAVVGQLTLQSGALLDVVNGQLSLDPLGVGQYHTIAGSFTFFNCLGSLDINANTTFSGSTLGIASDIHVASGVTLVVLGSLNLDGCTLDSAGTFNLLVNFGASFSMARCDVSGAFMTLVGSDLTIHDSHFSDSSLTVFSTVNGGSIYHNIFEDGTGALNILPGTVVATHVEGWGNVADAESVKNRLSIEFRPPPDSTRTLDAGGNLFVQPGDLLKAGVDIGQLVDKAQAVEALLGYSTDHLAFDAVLPSATWTNGLFGSGDESSVIGRFNAAVGLGFSFPDPDGTLLDGQVADLQMTARALEGQTRVFFRTKTVEDEALLETRITASAAGAPYYRNAPFTRNSAVLTIDGTLPLFAAGATAIQIQGAVPVDVLQGGSYTREGSVSVTFDAYDELAGIDDADAKVEFTGGSATLSGTLVSTSPVDVGGISYTRYVFNVAVGPATPNGPYNVNATVMDRSGNVAVLPIGAVEVSKKSITVTVAPQNLVTTALTRDVVFVATNGSGAVLATWTVPVSFLGGVGSAVLQVPDGTVNLSAKMAWNLRRRLPASFDVNGFATVSFTGASNLKGGDLNGNNNVNSGDYNLMSSAFLSTNPQADITGNGVVNSGDYNILATNWLTVGDPP